jgi:hypothetical protein
MRRLALSFPQCPQSYLECPYFDLALFSFDEKFVSSLDGSVLSLVRMVKTDRLNDYLFSGPNHRKEHLSNFTCVKVDE